MTKFSYSTRYCPFCGQRLDSRSLFCPSCGEALNRCLLSKISPPYPWSPLATVAVIILTYGVWLLCLFPTLIYFIAFFGIPLTPSSILVVISDPLFMLIMMATELAFLVIPLGFVKGRGEPLERVGLTTGGIRVLLKDIALGAGAGLLLVPLMLGLMFYDLIGSGIGPSIPGPGELLWLGITCLSIWIFVAPTEELLFRGFAQKSFEAHFGNLAGLLTAAILFGMAHFNPLIAGVAHAIGGLLLGLVFRWRGRRLAAPIAAHATYDCVLMILDVFII